MRLKIILFNLSIIIFLICLIYLYIYVNYKYEGFEDPVKGSSGEVFRPDGARKDPITDTTTESNVLNESATIAKINPTLSELEKAGVSPETAIAARVMPYFNVGRAANNKPALSDGYYWIDFTDNNLIGALTSYAGATLNTITGSTNQYLLYNSSGSLVLRENYVCDILVVGGGGGASSRHGGAGGGGAVIYATNKVLPVGTYTINIGAGGSKSISKIGSMGLNGGDSSIIDSSGTTYYLAKGGGYGASLAAASGGGNGGNGGSGGGVSTVERNIATPGNALNTNIIDKVGGFKLGFNGGFGDGGGPDGSQWAGGGGGGAGQTGGNSTLGQGRSTNAGKGGDGIAVNITGVNTYYGGGGGGGINDRTNGSAGAGGLGGGGNGGKGGGTGADGVPNTGGGGGGGGWRTSPDGSSLGGNGGSGIVIIRFKERVSMGKKQLYCLMDKNYFGGGWMLAMRAVRGSRTFGYNSEHWTNATTLNDTVEKIRDVSFDADLNVSSIGNAIFNNYEGNTNAINRYDAKFDIFNRYKANEWMAIFYFKNHNNVVLKGGDIVTGGNQSAKGWIWRETNLLEGDKIERTPLQLFQKRSRMDRHFSLIDLRGNYGVRNAKNLDKFKPVNNMPQLWSSQHGYNFYGINYDVPEYYENYMNGRGASTRWGFAWNENWNYENNNQTNDVYGGIGLMFPRQSQPGYSAGDFIYCCHDSHGVNSSIAFEWYVR